jgi:succinate-semialdehyde dehydrogenase/glutarate-semialdehyde dehydrogenase
MIQTVNPATGEKGRSYKELDPSEIDEKIGRAQTAFRAWRSTPFDERTRLLSAIADRFDEHKDRLARLMTEEMGKPIRQSVAEIEKCAGGFRFYAESGPAMLADKVIDLGEGKARVRWLPQGPVLAVMPWNFPFWQVVRFLAPNLMAGNVGLLKHSSLTPGCAAAIEEMVLAAGAPQGLFQNLAIGSGAVAGIIADPRVVAVTLTGSEGAGMKVAEAAGKALKKVVLELGGSDPFVVMPSADIEKAAGDAVKARLLNGGQSCICAKRMIVQADVYDAFLERFSAGMRAAKVGDPLDEASDMGPLSSEQACDDIARQVDKAVAAGATKLFGGERLDRPGAWFTPAVLVDIPRDHEIAREEFFGPVAMVFKVRDIDEAIEVANDIPFGLGSSIWTQIDAERERMVDDIESGMTAVNQILASDPRAPFGGVKRSGHGRWANSASMSS